MHGIHLTVQQPDLVSKSDKSPVQLSQARLDRSASALLGVWPRNKSGDKMKLRLSRTSPEGVRFYLFFFLLLVIGSKSLVLCVFTFGPMAPT